MKEDELLLYIARRATMGRAAGAVLQKLFGIRQADPKGVQWPASRETTTTAAGPRGFDAGRGRL